MKDKYYTPNISEFHIGFEYEIQPDYEGEWIKMNKLDNGFYANFNVFNTEPTAIMPICYRVKYLDRKDIESLGQVYYKTLPGTSIMVYETKDYELWHNHATHHISIQMKEEGDSTLFTGTIKNISEFKIILKQLGITK